MRVQSLLLSAGLLLLAADAGAQSGKYPMVADSGAISSVQVTGQARPARVYQQDLDAVRGQYALSNGWRLKIDSASNGISAQIDKQRPMHLIAVSKDRYVSRDGNVDMQFGRGDYGDDMVMSYVPDPRLAQIIVVRATLAQR